jgi:hypothetical protein
MKYKTLLVEVMAGEVVAGEVEVMAGEVEVTVTAVVVVVNS